MARPPTREFQVFAKPVGPACNLACRYCYYVGKATLLADSAGAPRMSDTVLEAYIAQHVRAAPGPVVNFSWHGGEPTLAGLDFFRKIVQLQNRHAPPGKRIANGIQTNGTLLDTAWCQFLAAENFFVGISLDGPVEMHDCYRLTGKGGGTHERVARGLRLLQRHGIPHEILCVVHADNVRRPLDLYRYLRSLGAAFLTFLPLVETDRGGGISGRSVPTEAFGDFLCAVFDIWKSADIGRIKIQIIEEAARCAFGQPHSLCIFRRSCGDIPVVEHNGDVYSCDHYVDEQHLLGNIGETALADLIESPRQSAFGNAKWQTLPETCRSCGVLEMCNGGCPKDRFLKTADGQPGLNYLCAGYRRFFTHCRPFVEALATEWRRKRGGSSTRPAPKTGRNDPCPCGSGRKYKKCCLK